MRPLIFLIRGIVYSNLFVSICAAALTLQTYLLLNLNINYFVAVLVGTATFFTYNLQRLFRLKETQLVNKFIGIRLSWIIRHKRLLFILSIIAILISFVCVCLLTLKIFLALVPLLLFSIIYVIPVIPYKNKRISLRLIPGIKTIIITTVWTLSSVLLPVLNEENFINLLNTNFYLTLLKQFIFIFAITLPFNIRDLKFDLYNNLKTIPKLIGIRNTIFLSHFFIFIFISLSLYQYYVLNTLNLKQLLSLIVTSVFTLSIVAFTSPKRPELYFSFLIEGTMLLQFFGLLIMEY